MADRYPLIFVYQDAAHILKSNQHNGTLDLTPTTIRTIINNLLDGWDKAGFVVNHDYNQDRAVATVKRLFRAL